MQLLEKLGYGGKNKSQLGPVLTQWGFILIALLGPLLFNKVDSVMTTMSISMATTQYSWFNIPMFSIGVLVWGFYLYKRYRESKTGEFDMERDLLDPEKKRIEAEGKSTDWIDQFRLAYRRRQYMWIIATAVFYSVVIMYYEIFVSFIIITRKHLNVMKGDCTSLHFSFLEKIYIGQFLKDLPFSMADIFNLYGSCTPNTDSLTIRVLTSLASCLHWALIILIVGSIWKDQIRGWFTGPKASGS